MKPIIQVEGISKQFRIGTKKESYRTLRESLAEGVSNTWNRLRGDRDPNQAASEFWALKDVSFDVQPGEVVGIIGRNGSGKSTLLKILSQIYEPTSGRAVLRGRLASLLEVGTGFHPELTGRENIYLNGSILGMTRREILRKFDEIVAFSEIEKFLDTPVKRYSSGMYVRLAFAVAAHLDPEILIVDEVLAVGDAQFQKKCLGKMQQVKKSGKSVIIVSHQTETIRSLCQKIIWLDNGSIKQYGNQNIVLSEYLENTKNIARPGDNISLINSHREGVGTARFASVKYTGESQQEPCSDGPLHVLLNIFAYAEIEIDSLAVAIYDNRGLKLVNADSITLCESMLLIPGTNIVRISILSIHLKPGIFRLGLWLSKRTVAVYDVIENAIEIEIFPNHSRPLTPKANNDGVVTCEYQVTRC